MYMHAPNVQQHSTLEQGLPVLLLWPPVQAEKARAKAEAKAQKQAAKAAEKASKQEAVAVRKSVQGT
jgi:hypothetical protein